MKLKGLVAALGALTIASTASAQGAQDPVIQRIWRIGMDSSKTQDLMQVLTDSIGPRLTGSPGINAGHDWLVKTYRAWGVNARNEQYGTWRGWRRGITHVDLITPRVRSLEGTMLAWSPGTNGRPVEAGVVILPDVKDSTEFVRWLPQVRGKFVLISMPQPTCRDDASWREGTDSMTFERMRQARTQAMQAWNNRVRNTGYATGLGTGSLGRRLEQAGAAGVIASRWSNGWGVNKVFNTLNNTAPGIDLSCEDYGLVFRMAEKGQNPTLRVTADAENLGEVPVFNTIAEIRGTEKPDEYVMLSAHFDSWDGGSGATDNATGTVTMLEAIRILRQVYPNPKRTILVGHWGGEEQGLNGSRAYAQDNPKVVAGLHALFNQDNGTGRVVNIGGQGLQNAEQYWTRWLAKMPAEITGPLRRSFPGNPSAGGSDNAAFACSGAPGFSLGSAPFDYGTYTWHTNRDTYDKVSFDDVKNNATMTAMLVYLASEDPQMLSRERATLTGPDGRARNWPDCGTPQRNSQQYFR